MQSSGSGSSNRGEEHHVGRGFQRGQRPLGTRFCRAKSSVLYLLRPLTLERGCPSPDRPFTASAEQGIYCQRQWQKIPCSFEWAEEITEYDGGIFSVNGGAGGI